MRDWLAALVLVRTTSAALCLCVRPGVCVCMRARFLSIKPHKVGMTHAHAKGGTLLDTHAENLGIIVYTKKVCVCATGVHAVHCATCSPLWLRCCINISRVLLLLCMCAYSGAESAPSVVGIINVRRSSQTWGKVSIYGRSTENQTTATARRTYTNAALSCKRTHAHSHMRSCAYSHCHPSCERTGSPALHIIVGMYI